METLLYFAGLLLVIVAQSKVQGAYRKYSKIMTASNLTGADTARKMLKEHGITDIEVVQSRGGTLSDHYDSRKKIVALSPENYNTNSIAAVSVAAHEVGHAIQHNVGYKMIDVRNAILPSAIIAGNMSWIVIVLGLVFSITSLLYVGIGMLGVIATFQLVTLPVEFDASKRALANLEQGNYLYSDELVGAKSMLRAAAFTYVAGLLNTVFQLVRLIMASNRRR
ncbi:zinc metallopeptidase [Erysipelotrichaceae bacterium]|nr:zinc metallopeptidase [Erysipelotrichaceae bacterium]